MTSSPSLDAARQVLQAQTFSQLVGAELTRFDAQDGVELQLPLTPRLRQQHGFAHGGVLSYAADNALTFAGGLVLGAAVVTAEFKINYLRPALGTRLIARAQAVHAGRSQAVCRCDVLVRTDDGTELLCAVAQGSIARIGTPPGSAAAP
ncbi:PaaI family thioesterase [Corticibacter populi]|uniref:Medium/long-chain acyl-CoA thioesterase YigI n=1 Tax=Corticibacter populi TaxID=1550736 RepID=A0A3M6QRV1_9BURK|nr:PaaI family thioesterase [Corticibacter populi]RMX05758.1 PaaI family thioesterase [Corticibacter populi]RZS30941.1 uncharacterized protein (TIGR00369 family) [Corticibacter populi]